VLGAQHAEESEAVGGLASGGGGVDKQDLRVAIREEGVTVDLEGTDLGMDEVLGLGAWAPGHVVVRPERRELGGNRVEAVDQLPGAPVVGVPAGGDRESSSVGARQPLVVCRSVQSALVGVGEAPVRSFLLQPPRIWRRG